LAIICILHRYETNYNKDNQYELIKDNQYELIKDNQYKLIKYNYNYIKKEIHHGQAGSEHRTESSKMFGMI
jgi:hypothetical protein